MPYTKEEIEEMKAWFGIGQEPHTPQTQLKPLTRAEIPQDRLQSKLHPDVMEPLKERLKKARYIVYNQGHTIYINDKGDRVCAFPPYQSNAEHEQINVFGLDIVKQAKPPANYSEAYESSYGVIVAHSKLLWSLFDLNNNFLAGHFFYLARLGKKIFGLPGLPGEDKSFEEIAVIG